MEEKSKAKRLVAEVTPEFFWEVKKGLADRQIKIKDFIILSLAFLLNISSTTYTVDVENQAAFDKFIQQRLEERK